MQFSTEEHAVLCYLFPYIYFNSGYGIPWILKRNKFEGSSWKWLRESRETEIRSVSQVQEQERHFLALVRKGHSKEISKTWDATAIDTTVNKVVINSRYQREQQAKQVSWGQVGTQQGGLKHTYPIKELEERKIKEQVKQEVKVDTKERQETERNYQSRHRLKGLPLTAVEAKGGLRYLESKSVISGGRKENQQEKWRNQRQQEGSRDCQDLIKLGEKEKVFQVIVKTGVNNYSHNSVVINCISKYCWKYKCHKSARTPQWHCTGPQ